MNGLKQRWELSFRVEIGRWCQANGAGGCRTQIRQNITKQITGDHHAKAVWLQHKACRQNINVLLVGHHIWVVLTHHICAFVPPRHAHGDAVALGCNGEVLSLALARFFEGVAQHTVRTHA